MPTRKKKTRTTPQRERESISTISLTQQGQTKKTAVNVEISDEPRPIASGAIQSSPAKKLITNTDRTVLTALRENNKCLAAALDDSRKEFRKLQTKYVNLQRERQQLLEKIASLETKVSQKDLEIMCTQVQPTYELLEQAVKDIVCAEKHLKGIFQLQIKGNCPWTKTNSVPAHVSPVSANCSNDMAVIPSVHFEADCGVGSDTVKGRKIYPKTPPPSHPIYSTPVSNYDNDLGAFLECPPCAVEFEDSVTEASLYGEKVLDDATSIQVENEPHEKQGRARFSRPQRKCTTINISYQEPDLKRKLCHHGDHMTIISSRTLRKSTSSTPKQRLVLEDITNRLK